MCPDRQILSVYLDNELPSPWKEALEAHLAQCPQCREKLASYRRISAFMTGNMDVSAAREQVRQKIENFMGPFGPLVERDGFRRRLPRGGVIEGSFSPVRRPSPYGRFWRRQVAIPLPGVIAAAALLVLTFSLAVANFAGRTVTTEDTAIAAGMSLDVQGIIPVSDMNSVLQYLGDDNSADFMIIRLPDIQSFSSAGQPTIIKASDYSRRNPN